ncbi:serine hydrolase [Streptomyces sp. 4N509B]|uniref:serine hydrolase n=1 Tax=Streptomyces sp. 4N509B TaxID=3457413 RepID=UPI003FD48FAB
MKPIRRRRFLHGLPGVAGLAVTLSAASPAVAGSALGRGGAAAASGPPTVTPRDIRFPARSRPLRVGSPGEAGLLPGHVARIADEVAAFPHLSGFALVAVRDGVIVAHEARGHAVRYASWDEETSTAVELPPEEWVEATTDTVFDMASVTKLFTATVAVQLHEQGVLSLDEPVVAYLPEFAATDPAKAAVTVRQLLIHRSGLPSWLNLHDPSLPDNAARLAAVYAAPLAREPGSGYEYSDLGLITLGVLLERVTGRPLDALVADRVTGPLGMRDTLFNPPPELLPRVAATEYQPWTGRGMVRGGVHDENAWALGGVAGHAGIFSTTSDMAVFAQTLCDGGQYAGTRLLTEETVREVLTDHNADIGASPRGLGWQVNQRSYMDALCSPVTAGHTGYTGTSVTVDPVSRVVLVLLTNRVHPTRQRGTDSVYRRRPSRALARAVPVRPAVGRTAWYAGQADAATARLTVPLGPSLAATGTRATFRLWYDTEAEYDVGVLEASTDEGGGWRPVPFELRTGGSHAGEHRWESPGTFHGYAGRRWLHATVPELPAGTTRLRFTYTTDADYQGRGVYVDALRVYAGDRLLFASERPGDASRVVAEGWRPSAD